MKIFKDSKGFTLVELLIVMAVVIVLAAAVLPKVGSITQGAHEANTLAALSSAYTDAYTQYMANKAGGGDVTTVNVGHVNIETTTFSYTANPVVGGLNLKTTAIDGTTTGSDTWVKFSFNDSADSAELSQIKVAATESGLG